MATTNSDSSKATKSDSTPTAKSGMECDIKNLYQKEDARGRCTWTDVYPDHLDEAAENEITARYAILVRNKKSFDSRKKLEIDSIVIQSPLLKEAFKNILKDYPGITPTLKRLTFQAPFNPFVHRWTEFMRAIETEQDAETKGHLVLLHQVLEPELKDIIAAKLDYIENKVITYEHLWTIFQPGCTTYTREWDRPCAARFTSGNYSTHPALGPIYQLNCQRVDWDGERFGYATTTYMVQDFGGTTPIESLKAFPLEFHPEEKKIRTELLKRGQLFEKYHGYHFKYYKSFAIGKNQCGQSIKVTVDSRIIIDTFAYGKFNPNSLRPLASLNFKSSSSTDLDDVSDDEDVYEYDSSDDEIDYTPNSSSTTAKKDKTRIPLTNEQLILCTPLLKGYALKQKRWLEFLVDVPTNITWNDSAFDSLVLPASQKQLILAITTSQINHSSNFDDVIVGKGRGTIMLLSGGPGIGKTLTAESVAETMKVPLYMLSAGDLGVESTAVDAKLNLILEMVASWNAVLLLDECDVFLESRTSDSLERNKIVSIFLRTLEYYEGILFLTTNRVKNIDPAFQSRIHLSMEYPELDKSSRRKVWENFLKMGNGKEDKHVITEGEVGQLAEVDINGRQIKNVLKTAKLLAGYKGQALGYEHVRTVLSVEGR